MALAYLLDPFLQYQNRAGVNNVAGYIEVFRMDTDDRATVYTDFNGTLAPAHIGIDNDGYAVMIVESGIPYRVEIHAPNGDLFRTWQPVWPVAGGGGVSGTDIVSSDGSIAIDRTSVGSLTTYDLSSHVEDGTDLLEWIRTEGYTAVSGNMVPTYQAGSMEVYPDGIRLYGDRYYHLTGRIKATVHNLQPSYNEFKILVRGWDGEAYTTYLDMPAVIDGSMGSTQEWEFSTDIMPTADSDISVTVSGLDSANNSVGLLDMEVHRVYSGAPYIPGSVASRPWVEENFQEKLVAGDNITIEGNVISATGGGGGDTYRAGSAISITDDIMHGDKVIGVKLKTNGGLKLENSTMSPDWNSLEVKTDGYSIEVDPNGGALRAVMPVSPYWEHAGQFLTVDGNGETEWVDVNIPENATVIDYHDDSATFPERPMSDALDALLEKLRNGTASFPVYMRLPAFDGAQLSAGARLLQLVEWEYQSPWWVAEMKFSAPNRFYDNDAGTQRYGFEQLEMQWTTTYEAVWHSNRHEFAAFTPTIITLQGV